MSTQPPQYVYICTSSGNKLQVLICLHSHHSILHRYLHKTQDTGTDMSTQSPQTVDSTWQKMVLGLLLFFSICHVPPSGFLILFWIRCCCWLWLDRRSGRRKDGLGVVHTHIALGLEGRRKAARLVGLFWPWHYRLALQRPLWVQFSRLRVISPFAACTPRRESGQSSRTRGWRQTDSKTRRKLARHCSTRSLPSTCIACVFCHSPCGALTSKQNTCCWGKPRHSSFYSPRIFHPATT